MSEVKRDPTIMGGRVIKTIGDLKQYLADAEAQWSESDTEYLGAFDSQTIWVPYYSSEGKLEGYAEPVMGYPVFACCFVLDRPENI